MAAGETIFDTAYRGQLQERYGREITEQIADTWKWAPLSEQPDEVIPYVVTQPDEVVSERKLLYVPGFGESIINKASFAAEAATQGLAMILPGQNRTSILRDATNRRSAVHTQARNYLDVLDHATENGETVDVVPHSYGALIFQAMRRLDPDRFKDSNVVMLAPSNSIIGDTIPRLGGRWIKFLKSEMDQKRPIEFPDHSGVTSKASAKTLTANIPRLAREVGDLGHNQMDYFDMACSVGSLTVLGYAEDNLFPDSKVYPLMEQTMRALEDHGKRDNFRWATPVSPAGVLEGRMTYTGDGATHDDEQFNPSRVVSSVRQILASVA
jgi:pimeloyl-ACP methyl ester carboxylesterase